MGMLSPSPLRARSRKQSCGSAHAWLSSRACCDIYVSVPTDKPAALLALGPHHGYVVGGGSARRLATLPAAVVPVRGAGHPAGSLHLRVLHPDAAREA